MRKDTDDNLAHWYDEVIGLPNPVRRAFNLFVLYTGLRSEDARTVRSRDVDWEALTLNRPTPKDGEDRAFTIREVQETVSAALTEATRKG